MSRVTLFRSRLLLFVEPVSPTARTSNKPRDHRRWWRRCNALAAPRRCPPPLATPRPTALVPSPSYSSASLHHSNPRTLTIPPPRLLVPFASALAIPPISPQCPPSRFLIPSAFASASALTILPISHQRLWSISGMGDCRSQYHKPFSPVAIHMDHMSIVASSSSSVHIAFMAYYTFVRAATAYRRLHLRTTHRRLCSPRGPSGGLPHLAGVPRPGRRLTPNAMMQIPQSEFYFLSLWLL